MRSCEAKEAPLRGSWPSTPTIAIDATMRRGRVVEARRLAVETSKELQRKYREALVLEIEDELRQHKVRRQMPPAAPALPPCPNALLLLPTPHSHPFLTRVRPPISPLRRRGRHPGLSAWRRCRPCTPSPWS